MELIKILENTVNGKTIKNGNQKKDTSMDSIVYLNESQEPVTTSLAIAEGTQVQHKNVLELIRNNINDFNEFGRVAFETLPFETAGGIQKREVAILNEQQATLLFTYMRNSEIVKKFKIRLVKVFYEMRDRLHGQDPLDIFKDPAKAIELTRHYAEKVLALENKVAEQQPKVEGYDRITLCDGGLNMTNTAKNLDIPPKQFFRYLIENKWVYRRAGGKNLVAYQEKIQSGYLTHKVYRLENPDGTEKMCEQVIVTPKGLAKLSSMFSQQGELL